MNLMTARAGVTAWVLIAASAALAQDTVQTPEAPAPPAPATTPQEVVSPPPAPAPAKTVAVTINGKAVMQSEVEEMFNMFVQQRSGGRPLPPAMRDQLRTQMKPQILEMLIDSTLLDEQVETAHITVTEQQVREQLNNMLQAHYVRSGMTEEQFKERLQQGGMTLEGFMEERAKDENFLESMKQTRLLEDKFASELTVSENDIKSRYDRDLAEVYTKSAQVRASHILIGIERDANEETKETAKAKAEGLASEAGKPDADFAALAGQHSSCPSSAKGGDLGFFARQGAMVEPFAAAAFDLEVGKVSGVVETQFGYHIITVTERKDGTVLSLAQASGAIREQLKGEKLSEVRNRYVTELRDKATIVFTQ